MQRGQGAQALALDPDRRVARMLAQGIENVEGIVAVVLRRGAAAGLAESRRVGDPDFAGKRVETVHGIARAVLGAAAGTEDPEDEQPRTLPGTIHPDVDAAAPARHPALLLVAVDGLPRRQEKPAAREGINRTQVRGPRGPPVSKHVAVQLAGTERIGRGQDLLTPVRGYARVGPGRTRLPAPSAQGAGHGQVFLYLAEGGRAPTNHGRAATQ